MNENAVERNAATSERSKVTQGKGGLGQILSLFLLWVGPVETFDPREVTRLELLMIHPI